MVCLPFSNGSIEKIFLFLGDSASYVSRFRRTCRSVNNIATQKGFSKVNANTIVIGMIEAGSTCRILAAIERKKSNEEKKKSNSYSFPLHTVTHSVDFFSHCMESSNFVFATIPNGMDEKDLFMAISLVMKVVLNKVKSVDCIQFENISITPEIVNELRKYNECIRNATQLIIQNGYDTTVRSRQLSELLNLMNISYITIIPKNEQRNIVIGDWHLSNMKSIRLGWEYGDTTKRAGRITDRTLENWMRNIPLEIKIYRIKTSFTFKAMWNFIQHVTLYSTINIDFCFGIIDYNKSNFEAITQAQKERKFVWKQKQIGDILRTFELNYALNGFRSHRFTFYMERYRRNDHDRI